MSPSAFVFFRFSLPRLSVYSAEFAQINKIFPIFNTVIWIAFKISFCNCPLLVYRSTAGFYVWSCIQRLCWIHRLILTGVGEVPLKRILAPVNTIFILHSICILSDPHAFYFFFLPTARARAYSCSVRQKWSEWTSCLVSIISGKGFSFSLLSVWAGGIL